MTTHIVAGDCTRGAGWRGQLAAHSFCVPACPTAERPAPETARYRSRAIRPDLPGWQTALDGAEPARVCLRLAGRFGRLCELAASVPAGDEARGRDSASRRISALCADHVRDGGPRPASPVLRAGHRKAAGRAAREPLPDCTRRTGGSLVVDLGRDQSGAAHALRLRGRVEWPPASCYTRAGNNGAQRRVAGCR